MNKIRVFCLLICFFLLAGLAFNLTAGRVLAAEGSDNTTAPDEYIELTSPYPVLRENAGNLFEFQVALNYHGSKDRVFDLTIVSNTGAYADILASFTAADKGIESILVKPDQEYPDVVKVRYNPALERNMEPGKYVITLRATSGNISDSIDLTAVVIARYDMYLNTDTGRLNAEVTAGQDNHIGIYMTNASTTDINEVRFSANVPQGWGISFTPTSADSLGVKQKLVSDMVITPDSNTIAGDYEIKVTAISNEVFSEMKLRVTVVTPSIWGWVSIIIIVVIIAGLVTIFLVLGRR